jgi:hypothetical protein
MDRDRGVDDRTIAHATTRVSAAEIGEVFDNHPCSTKTGPAEPRTTSPVVLQTAIRECGSISSTPGTAYGPVGRSADTAEGARRCPRRRGTSGVALFRIPWDHLGEVRLRNDLPWLGSSVAYRAEVAACDEVRHPQPLVVLLPCVIDLECRCDAA